MDIEMLTQFFMWCTIFNSGLLVLWVVFLKAAPDVVFYLQRPWFSGTRESWDLLMYGFLAVFKILVLVFNVVPWIALVVLG